MAKSILFSLVVILSLLNYITLAVNNVNKDPTLIKTSTKTTTTNEMKLSSGIYLFGFIDNINPMDGQNITVIEVKSGETISNTIIFMPYQINGVLSLNETSNNVTLYCTSSSGFVYLIEVDPFNGSYSIISNFPESPSNTIWQTQPFSFIGGDIVMYPVEQYHEEGGKIYIHIFDFKNSIDYLVHTGLITNDSMFPFGVYNNIDNRYYITYQPRNGTTTSIAKINLTNLHHVIYEDVKYIQYSQVRYLTCDIFGNVIALYQTEDIGNPAVLCKFDFDNTGNDCTNIGTFQVKNVTEQYPRYNRYITSADNSWFGLIDSSDTPEYLTFLVRPITSYQLDSAKYKIPNYWRYVKDGTNVYFTLNVIQ